MAVRPGRTWCSSADANVGPLFGAERYLEYVRTSGGYDSEHRPATVEYSNLPDAVDISVWKGGAHGP